MEVREAPPAKRGRNEHSYDHNPGEGGWGDESLHVCRYEAGFADVQPGLGEGGMVWCGCLCVACSAEGGGVGWGLGRRYGLSLVRLMGVVRESLTSFMKVRPAPMDRHLRPSVQVPSV
jgi:hypothetical protein